ncbi:hypothetical protein GCM10023172_04560 [Hymenobacter ginsengisoli]|uniref:STAS/SEC14 domain-containing protein n=1 Tax=Hymenobacter ginsengisoli TaxID=1051626 RepID=A0ABP8PY63_9BACT|nr:MULTISPECIES: hypothetical protein [unclassified Hymenobacter]MBO2030558.1 hypothetical protein [Hymenobacter sp. BT559]
MSAPATSPPDSFTLDYRPEQRLLIGRWLRPVSLDEIKTHYAALLDAAVAHGNCRHWLLDVRRRDIYNAAAIAWFADFGHHLPEVLGGPVALAYFAMVDQAGAAANTGLDANIRQGAEQGSYYRYFNHEQEALTWLLAQP